MSIFINASNDIAWKRGVPLWRPDLDHEFASLSPGEIGGLMRGSATNSAARPCLGELPVIPITANRKAAAN